eukprot:11197291-Lingulodinium_polyedra.AAC.1
MQMGVWKHYSECPFWGGPLAGRRNAPGTQEGEQQEVAAATRGAKVAKVTRAVVASGSAIEGQATQGAQQMKAEDTDLKAIRQRCGNSLWTAGAILCKDDLRHLSAMVQELTRPFYSTHTENVLLLNSEENTRE